MEKIYKNLCDYGCGKYARYKFKNGKYCCSKSKNSCPENRKIRGLARTGIKHSKESKNKMSEAKMGSKHRLYGKERKPETKLKIGKSNEGREVPVEIRKKISEKTKEGMKKKEVITKMKELGELKKLTKELINKRYPFFSKIEEMRYNPESKKEIQVRCKNRKCSYSKEQDGWFTPTYIQLYERIRQLEKDYGNEGGYFYCCENCKKECVLYGLKSDPFKKNDKHYNEFEYQIFREFVLERDNYICQFCGEKAIIVHHERPQKLEPFFSLDPDYAWSCCEKCHYEKGHKDECSTGNLSKKKC